MLKIVVSILCVYYDPAVFFSGLRYAKCSLRGSFLHDASLMHMQLVDEPCLSEPQLLQAQPGLVSYLMWKRK